MTKKKTIASAVHQAVAEAPPPPSETPPRAAAPAQALTAVDPRVPKTATLLVTAAELQILYNALDELPGKFGRALFGKISAQVQEQIDAALRAPPPK